ncbi:ImmA/IrrE family metallo-endopeptidase [Alicyclobacillus fastidiosus]|uniref:ImmA/IrrE family metallo-endopeptidase n=1 Tax=Alicyclobacillus fastidiosus TaxID=392011 RepID=A0ABV5ALN6_9BACL|nr:ImmA/IrrE family metallo-endopeptidase [Alicyclobacillus fastidiosus]WEH08517.1 ImmA/IrrE family metallo-endopeptidase [Alicyclobacillus fastidiosus]
MRDDRLDSLLRVVKTEGIFLSFQNLTDSPEPVLGIHFCDQDKQQPFIVLERELKNDLPAYRCVLAELLGHHLASFEANISYPYTSCWPRKHPADIAAMKWATTFLIPTKKLDNAFANGITAVSALAEHFGVTEWFMQYKLDIFKAERTERPVMAVGYSKQMKYIRATTLAVDLGLVKLSVHVPTIEHIIHSLI